MHYTDLMYTCSNPKCCQEEGLEAQVEESDDKIHVLCGLCGIKRDYPKKALNRETPALVAEHLRGFFEVTKRYVTNQAVD